MQNLTCPFKYHQLLLFTVQASVVKTTVPLIRAKEHNICMFLAPCDNIEYCKLPLSDELCDRKPTRPLQIV